MFKYFNEEETNEIFNNNKDFKNILENIPNITKNTTIYNNWLGISFIDTLPNELKNLLILKSSHNYEEQLFPYNIKNIKESINYKYMLIFEYEIKAYMAKEPLKASECRFYEKYNSENIIVIKGEKYFYIFCSKAVSPRIELFYMKRTDKNENDLNYYKIEMNYTL